MKDHVVLEFFAESLNWKYFPLTKICEDKRIPFPQGRNFDGCFFKGSSDIVPVEHTSVAQHQDDFVLEKLCTGQKRKLPKNHSPGESSFFSKTIDGVRKKHSYSDGYLNCANYLRNLGFMCAKSGFLFLERNNAYCSCLYGLKEFQEEVSLLKNSVCLDYAIGSSFFRTVFFGVVLYPRGHPEAHLDVIYGIDSRD